MKNSRTITLTLVIRFVNVCITTNAPFRGVSTDGAVRFRTQNTDVALSICERSCLSKESSKTECRTNISRARSLCSSLSCNVQRVEITEGSLLFLGVNGRVTKSSPVVCNRHYETDITSCPGLDCAARGQVCDVSCPTERGLFASRGLVPTGLRGGAGGGSDAGDASDERAERPPGLEAELRGVSASPSLDASDISSSFTSSSEHGDWGVTMGRGTVPDAAARASMYRTHFFFRL